MSASSPPVLTRRSTEPPLPQETRKASGVSGFSKAGDIAAFGKQREEEPRVSLGMVATGISCPECRELCANDSVLFHHMRLQHAEAMFGPSAHTAKFYGPGVDAGGSGGTDSSAAAVRIFVGFFFSLSRLSPFVVFESII